MEPQLNNRPHLRTQYCDAAYYCYRPSSVASGLSVGLSQYESAKAAEPIEIPFRLWTRVVPRNHVLDVGADHA